MFNSILNMNFGGTHGEMLQRLTRIAVHMGNLDASFVGVAFYYNGDMSLTGRQGRTEVSFLIDGARGERMVEVTTEQASTSAGIQSLYVRLLENPYFKLARDAYIDFRFVRILGIALCSCLMSFGHIPVEKFRLSTRCHRWRRDAKP